MPNWCHVTALVTGDKEQVGKLDAELERILSSRKPKVESDFGTGWLGNVLEEHGIDYRSIHCRGSVTNVSPHGDDGIVIEAETDWSEASLTNTLETLFESRYDKLRVLWYAEEPGCEYYCSNDHELRICPGRYAVDHEIDGDWETEYAATEQDALDLVGRLSGTRPASIGDVPAVEATLRENDPDAVMCVYPVSFVSE